MTKSAAKPSARLTTISVSRMPTLNASSAVLRRLAAKHEEQERLLGADPGRADREQRRELCGDLDEQRVVHGRGQPERAAGRRGRPASRRRPVDRLPERDAAEVGAPVPQDREALGEPAPEVADLLREPEHDDEHDRRARPRSPSGTCRGSGTPSRSRTTARAPGPAAARSTAAQITRHVATTKSKRLSRTSVEASVA